MNATENVPRLKSTGAPGATGIAASLDILERLFARKPLVRVGFRLWDGTMWPRADPRPATIVLRHPGSLRAMFQSGSEKAMAEAYLRDDFDVVGDMESAFEIADALEGSLGWRRSLILGLLLRRIPGGMGLGRGHRRVVFDRGAGRHSLKRDRDAIAFHYDVSNNFYRLWLDRRMVYSCAYFDRSNASLDSAQEAKLDYICRKLRLSEGQHLLDIGCGWGGLAVFAAQNYGVNVTGVTLSRQQASWAAANVSTSGLSDRVTILCDDYRNLGRDRIFDAAVSVGMSEHVGEANLPGYFHGVAALLRPGSVFLNHAIGEGCRYSPRRGPSFIDEYVFPDSDIPPLERVLTHAASAGFEIRDAENLREHYALTLRHWVNRLEERHDDALGIVNEPTYRIWRLYMAGSAHGFELGRLAVYQVLLAKLDAQGRARLPLTRGDWYLR